MSASARTRSAPTRAWLLELVRSLQTTLDLTELLRLFSDKCDEAIAHDGVSFVALDKVDEIAIGTRTAHRCEYAVAADRQELGTIAFTRSRPFDDAEMETLETLLSNLIYPLRNALTHGDAVRAASRDALTGLLNRASLDQVLTREVRLAQRHGSPLCMILVDVDHFKRVNDTHGHRVGDATLRAVARRLHERVRNSDIVFRYGGEEFVIVLSNTALAGARLLAGRIRTCVNARPVEDLDSALTVAVTVSAGVAERVSGEYVEAFFARADRALYRAKHDGRNCVRSAPAPRPSGTAPASPAVCGS